MKTLRILKLCMLLTVAGIISSCDKEDEETTSSTTNVGVSNKQNITKPTFDSFLTTTDLDGFSIRARFKTGGDSESNMSATVHWSAYSKKPSKTPSKNELEKTESMRQYGSAVYHNTGSKKGMTESIVFDKSHGGYNGGTYIYYYVECKNSVGTATSSLTYTIVKRSGY